MARIRVVTGYIPLPGHPRALTDFYSYGEKLVKGINCPIWEDTSTPVKNTWLYSWLAGDSRLEAIHHSIADNPAKNTLAYHCVQHEKFRWLQRALRVSEPDYDFFVWIDFGILHVPGVTLEVINEYLTKLALADDFIHIPGCWYKDGHVSQEFPCWRFCGGLMAVPAHLVEYFSQLCRVVAMEHIMKTNNVDWEVNTLARVELTNKLPIRWYQADHNQTMFTNLS